MTPAERVIQELRDLAAERDLTPGLGFLMGRMADDLEAAQPVYTDRTSVTAEADKLAGAVNALAAMERAAKGWADGAAENEEALGRRDRKPSDEQPFVLADILNMIDDAAREVGVAPVYSERSKKP